MTTDDCERCGEPFEAGKAHLKLAEQQVPPGNPPRGHVLHSDCSDDFREFLRGAA